MGGVPEVSILIYGIAHLYYGQMVVTVQYEPHQPSLHTHKLFKHAPCEPHDVKIVLSAITDDNTII